MEICFFWPDRLRHCIDTLQASEKPRAVDLSQLQHAPAPQYKHRQRPLN